MVFPAGGSSYLCLRVYEAEHAEDFKAVLRGEVLRLSQFVAGNGKQEVDWNGFCLKITQHHGQLNEFFRCFSHTGDDTGADFKACRTGSLQGIQPVFKCVRGADS